MSGKGRSRAPRGPLTTVPFRRCIGGGGRSVVVCDGITFRVGGVFLFFFFLSAFSEVLGSGVGSWVRSSCFVVLLQRCAETLHLGQLTLALRDTSMIESFSFRFFRGGFFFKRRSLVTLSLSTSGHSPSPTLLPVTSDRHTLSISPDPSVQKG